MNTEFLRLIPSGLTIIYVTYGSWFLVKEIFYSIVPFGILFTAIIVFSIHFFRIPAPDEAAVEAVLGKEPHLQIDPGQYVMKTVSHRGCPLDAPENSLEGFKMCSEKGCDAIEFDVSLTSDGVPIIFHDKTLERLTDLKLVVHETKWEDLQNIDISVKHSLKERFTNTNIPTLDQAVSQMLACGQRMFIDIKDNDTQMVPVIITLFNKYPELVSRAAVTSFFPNIIYMIRRSNPKIVGCLAWRPHVFAYTNFRYPEGRWEKRAKEWYKHYFLYFCDIVHEWALSRITYYLLGLSTILLHKDALSGAEILKWREKGVRVITWTVNSPTEKQHVARNLKITYLTDTLIGENTTHTLQNCPHIMQNCQS